MNNQPYLPKNPEDLTNEQLNAYIENFLDIADFKIIDNGKALLDLIRQHPDHPKLKPAIRKVIGLFGCDAPAGKVCALQFLKQSLQSGSFFAVECIDRSILVHFAEIIEYRSNVKSIQRGSNYFIREFDKNIGDDEMMNLIKLSSTFFRMVHECLWVWGTLYFPGSAFDKLRIKMEKKVSFPQFPKEFKFFSENKVNNFKERCSSLIKRIEERGIAATQSMSVISKKGDTVSKDKNVTSSPRNIKKTKEAPRTQTQQQIPSIPQTQKQIQNSKQMKKRNEDQANEESQLEKMQEQMDNLPSSKRTERHISKKNKEKKTFIQNIKEQTPSQKNIQSNNSKIRKKQSFAEVPFDLQHRNSNQDIHSSQQKEIQLSNGGQKVPKGQIAIKTIQQGQQSDGGRYSMEQTMSKQSEISEVLYDYHNREEYSPSSQYSLANNLNKQSKQFELKRENSQQIPPSITVRGKDRHKEVKIVINNEEKQINIASKQANQQNKQQPKSQDKKKYSFKLPLNQIKGKVQITTPRMAHKEQQGRASKERQKRITARKKFVSSEEQSIKQLKQQSKNQQKTFVFAKNFHESSSFQYKNQQKIAQKLPFKESKDSLSKKQYQNVDVQHIISPQKPRQLSKNDIIKENTQSIVPSKVPKPVKLKSNVNLKTVFESSDYQVHQSAVNCTEKQEKKQQSKPKDERIEKQSKIEALQQKTIPKQPAVASSKNQAKKGSIFQAVQVDTIQTINEITPIVYKNEKRPSSPPVQSKQHIQQSSKNTKQVVKTPSNPKKQTNFPIERTVQPQLKQPAFQDNIKTHENQHQLQRPSLKTMRNNSIYSSRFRRFKEVNLFIQPKATEIPHSLSTSQKIAQQSPIPTDNDKQESKISEQISKIRFDLSKIQETLNNTLNSQIINNNARKQTLSVTLEIGTQTRIKHKSKSKFVRKNKNKLFDQGNQSQQNKSIINLPIDTTNVNAASKSTNTQKNMTKQTQQLSSSSIDRKNGIKQELKPNTLLNALYKRKHSIN